MPRKTLVDEGVISGHQIHDIAILANYTFEDHFGFPLEGLAQVVVEVGEFIVEGCGRPQIAQIEPLSGEILNQRICFRIGQHPAHLRTQDSRILQFACGAGLDESIVGDAAPEEERQP